MHGTLTAGRHGHRGSRRALRALQGTTRRRSLSIRATSCHSRGLLPRVSPARGVAPARRGCSRSSGFDESIGTDHEQVGARVRVLTERVGDPLGTAHDHAGRGREPFRLRRRVALVGAEHDEPAPRDRERRARGDEAQVRGLGAEALEAGPPPVPAVGARGRERAHDRVAAADPHRIAVVDRGVDRVPQRQRPAPPRCRSRARSSRSPRGSARRRRRSRR